MIDVLSFNIPFEVGDGQILAGNAQVKVPDTWKIEQKGKHIQWSDEDMLAFAKIVFFNAPGQAKKLLEEYLNCSAK